MKCQFCNNEFSNKQNLNSHQRNAKYCLKIQGVADNNPYSCQNCDKSFTKKFNYDRHIKLCKKTCVIETLRKQLEEKCIENEKLKTIITELRADKNDLRADYKELSITAVKRPTTTNKNVQINNYIKNMLPLLESDIKDNVQYLTLEHHVKGAEGYAEYALEFPFKDKIVCVDVARNKIKYKNEEGDIIEDIGFKKMMVKLCDALKSRSFDLSQMHYEKLSEKFTESEMEEYNFLETAMAISKCAAGRENEFCTQIIKMISKNTIVSQNSLCLES